MKKWMSSMVAGLVLLAGMPAAQAVRATAAMDVSFRIVETCSVRTTPAAAQDAEVHCQYQTPYRIQSGAQASQAAAQAPQRSERPHDTDAPAALTVWF